MTWTLTGDLGKFKLVAIGVSVDLNNDGDFTDTGEGIGTLIKSTTSISASATGVLETSAKHLTVVTAKDSVVCTGTKIVSDSATVTTPSTWRGTRPITRALKKKKHTA